MSRQRAISRDADPSALVRKTAEASRISLESVHLEFFVVGSTTVVYAEERIYPRGVYGGVMDERREEPSCERRVDSYRADKARILARLRRIEGQVHGIIRMVEEDRYCVDILVQLSSVIAAARSVGLLLLEDHIRGCVLGAEDKEAAIQELTEAIERFTRSVG